MHYLQPLPTSGRASPPHVQPQLFFGISNRMRRKLERALSGEWVRAPRLSQLLWYSRTCPFILVRPALMHIMSSHHFSDGRLSEDWRMLFSSLMHCCFGKLTRCRSLSLEGLGPLQGRPEPKGYVPDIAQQSHDSTTASCEVRQGYVYQERHS